jgi:hypothetical protein
MGLPKVQWQEADPQIRAVVFDFVARHIPPIKQYLEVHFHAILCTVQRQCAARFVFKTLYA